MKLDQLQSILAQLNGQYASITTAQVEPEKVTLMHCNAIELRGAIQLVNQLIALETAEASAPPGATGPTL